MKVSIIVPCFRAEAYIGTMLDCIRRQTHTEFEVIVVGNGPEQDAQSEIVSRYATKDSRISYCSLAVSGVSRARNFGLERAQGEWIAFVDADDIVPSDWLAGYLVHAEANPDLIAGGITFRDFNRNSVRRQDLPLAKDGVSCGTAREFVPVCLGDMAAAYSPCSKLFRAEFIRKAGLRFDEELSVYEDGVFSLEAFLRCEKVVLVRQTGYEYCNRGTGSAISRYHSSMERALSRRRDLIAEVWKRAGVPAVELEARIARQFAADSLDVLLNAFHAGSPLGHGERVSLAKRLFADARLDESRSMMQSACSNLPLLLYLWAFRLHAPRLCVDVFCTLFFIRRALGGGR